MLAGLIEPLEHLLRVEPEEAAPSGPVPSRIAPSSSAWSYTKPAGHAERFGEPVLRVDERAHGCCSSTASLSISSPASNSRRTCSTDLVAAAEQVRLADRQRERDDVREGRDRPAHLRDRSAATKPNVHGLIRRPAPAHRTARQQTRITTTNPADQLAALIILLHPNLRRVPRHRTSCSRRTRAGPTLVQQVPPPSPPRGGPTGEPEARRAEDRADRLRDAARPAAAVLHVLKRSAAGPRLRRRPGGSHEIRPSPSRPKPRR